MVIGIGDLRTHVPHGRWPTGSLTSTASGTALQCIRVKGRGHAPRTALLRLKVRMSPRQPHSGKQPRRILDAAFFDRPPEIVARELLGKYLMRRIGRRVVAMPITETEAYGGEDDRASHDIDRHVYGGVLKYFWAFAPT